MKHTIRHSEAGAALVVAMSLIVMLTLLGLVVMQQVHIDTEVAGAEKNATNALYAAQAGLDWGIEEIETKYPGVSLGTVLSDYAATPVPAGDVDCTPTGCVGWYLLTPSPVSFDKGTYRVMIFDDEWNESTNPNSTILMRAVGKYGVGFDQAKRMVEIAIQR